MTLKELQERHEYTQISIAQLDKAISERQLPNDVIDFMVLRKHALEKEDRIICMLIECLSDED